MSWLVCISATVPAFNGGRVAEKVVREIDEKKAQGIGVFTVDGKMIDIAFYDGAKRTLMLAKAAGIYKGDLV